MFNLKPFTCSEVFPARIKYTGAISCVEDRSCFASSKLLADSITCLVRNPTNVPFPVNSNSTNPERERQTIYSVHSGTYLQRSPVRRDQLGLQTTAYHLIKFSTCLQISPGN